MPPHLQVYRFLHVYPALFHQESIYKSLQSSSQGWGYFWPLISHWESLCQIFFGAAKVREGHELYLIKSMHCLQQMIRGRKISFCPTSASTTRRGARPIKQTTNHKHVLDVSIAITIQLTANGCWWFLRCTILYLTGSPEERTRAQGAWGTLDMWRENEGGPPPISR